jgi:N-methylhydantoinase A
MPYAVAVDIGGTFTDLVAYDAETRRVAYSKSPTTYGNLVDGVLDCFAKAKRPRAASFVNHGTTLVINALIQRKGAKAALVTTKGFRDVLEIAAATGPIRSTCTIGATSRSFPRVLRFEVTERIGSNGEIVTPLDMAALAPLAKSSNSSASRRSRSSS